MMIQRWRIDDTSEPGHVFCEHLQSPRLVGELLPRDRTPEDVDALPAPGNRWLAVTHWLEDEEEGIYYEEQDMYDSLADALAAHEAAKASNGSLQRTVSGTSVTRR